MSVLLTPKRIGILSGAAHFADRALELLREAGEEAYKRYEGKTLRVLCEGRGRTDESLFTGKSRQNIIVDFDGDESMIGKFVDVKITRALNWALVGEVIK